jgi:hypothetical protein
MKCIGVFWLASLSIGSWTAYQVQPAKAKEIAEFKKRTKAETYQEDGVAKVKVTADETCLYDGPGKNGRVEVETRTPLDGQIFLSVRVEGEEVVRLWVRSLAKPVRLPPTIMVNPEKANYSSSSQSTNGKSSCKIELSGTTVYEGPGGDVKHEVLGKGEKRSYCIRVDEEFVYTVPIQREKKKEGEAGTVPGGSEKREPGKEREVGKKNKDGERAPASGEAAIALVIERINKYRKGAGLHEVGEDKELTKACQMHAEYLALNPDVEDGACHREDRDRKGYSESGAKCAPRSVINHSPGSRDAVEGLESLMATLYHRANLLTPQLFIVGVGMAEYGKQGLILVMDVGSEMFDPKRDVRPVLYPYVDQKEVPLDFKGTEWPNPVPEKEVKAGYPITIACDPLGWKPGEAVASLLCGKDEVPCWVSTPEKPANAGKAQPGVVCLIPKAPLKPLTQYTVIVRCKKYGVEKTPEWSKTWSFTTMAAEK